MIQQQGEELVVKFVAPLSESGIAPPLNVGQKVSLRRSYICECGEIHLDVGLESKHNWISCHKCGEELPEGDKTHWAHISRFEGGLPHYPFESISASIR